MSGLFDKVKDMAKKASSGGSTQHAPADPNAPPAQKQDYGDKAFSAISKKAGFNTTAEQNERITDGARDFYEKQTGSKVNSKFSN